MEQHELTLWQQPGVVPAFLAMCAVLLFAIKSVIDASVAMDKMNEEERLKSAIDRIRLDEHEERIS